MRKRKMAPILLLFVLIAVVVIGQEAVGALCIVSTDGDTCADNGCGSVGGYCVGETVTGSSELRDCTCQEPSGGCEGNEMLPRFQRPLALSRRGKLGRVFEHIRSAQSPMENEITKRQNGLSDASNSENDISWASRSVELEVDPEKHKVKTTFRFTNKGQSSVRVDSVRATCGGCSKAELSGKVDYEPGGRAHVVVTVDFPRWERTVTRGIWVTFRRPGGETFMEHLTVKLKRTGQPAERQTASLN